MSVCVAHLDICTPSSVAGASDVRELIRNHHPPSGVVNPAHFDDVVIFRIYDDLLYQFNADPKCSADTSLRQDQRIFDVGLARKQVDESQDTDNLMSGTVTQIATAAVPINARKAPPHVELRSTAYTRHVKPAIDCFAALCALFALAVPMLAIALLLVFKMGRPILFRQRRVGLNGTVFDVLKFRSMGPDRRMKEMQVQSEYRITHKSDEDPRHTRFGKILRRYSLDELPQLINILRGDMSIVGPRPELESVVNGNYPEHLKRRHLVRPGLTGLWQISARGDGPMHENGEWDLEYVEKISLLTDIKIICKTPFAMFGENRGN